MRESSDLFSYKITQWVILSLISVYFAEVISGSFKYPLFDVWGYISVIPIYGLHCLVLLYLSRKNLSINKLYFAGVLFGLYEAYLTKVLWTGLEPDAFMFMGLALLDYIVLVFLWHPIMSFIIPLKVYEMFFLSSNDISVPQYPVWLVIVLVGIAHAVNYSSPLEVLGANLMILVPLFILYKLNKRQQLEDIIPSKTEFRILFSVLTVYYLIFGLFILPEVVTFSNQLIVWISYSVFGFIFLKTKATNRSFQYEGKLIYFFYLIMIPIIITSFYWLGIRDVVMVTEWLIWVVMGLIILIENLRRIKWKEDITTRHHQ